MWLGNALSFRLSVTEPMGELVKDCRRKKTTMKKEQSNTGDFKPVSIIKIKIVAKGIYTIIELLAHKPCEIGPCSHVCPNQYSRGPLRWRHNGHDSVSNRQPHDCLLNRLFRRRSKKTSKRRVTGLCAGNSPGTGEFPAQMVSNAENVFIWWRHHAIRLI